MPHLAEDSCWKVLDLAQRGLFKCLLVLAGHSNNGGQICLQGMPDVPYTDEQLAAILCVPLDVFRRVLASIPADMVVRDQHQCLVVISWSNYQTEYERQKGYRTKLHPKVTPQKSEVRSQKSEEQKSDKDKREPSPDGLGLARFLNDQLIRVMPNIPSSKQTGAELERRLRSWALDFDRFGRIDGVSVADYRAVITWAMADDFWRTNIRSPGSLRTMKRGASAKVWVDFRERKAAVDPKAAELRRRAVACMNRPDSAGCGRKGEACAYCDKTQQGSKR